MGVSIECPYCHNHTAGKVPPTTGTTYVIEEVDTSKTPAIALNKYLPIDIYYCVICKNLVFKSSAIRAEG
jgi:hypothetical protein